MTVSTKLFQNGHKPSKEELINTIKDLEAIFISKAALKLFIIYVEAASHQGFADCYSHLLSRVFYQAVTTGHRIDQFSLQAYLVNNLGWSSYASDKVFSFCSTFNGIERLMLDPMYLLRRYPELKDFILDDGQPVHASYFGEEEVVA